MAVIIVQWQKVHFKKSEAKFREQNQVTLCLLKPL